MTAKSSPADFSRYHAEKLRQLALGMSVRSSDAQDELIVDNFAGGGGASTGMEQAFGREVDIAINHDGEALAMHTANHPNTAHYKEDVFDVNTAFITGQRRIGLGWFSPDCKHHSKAKGGKPREKKIRGLAWVVLKWGAFQRPRCLAIENVEELVDWGPLDEHGKPIKSEKGRTFRAFMDALTTGLDREHPDVQEILDALGDEFPMERLYEGLGYKAEYRNLRASDFGTPTIRRRLYIFARCDGQPIQWPTPSHGNPKAKDFKNSGLKPWIPIADCIDWSIETPSIFDRKKPLAEATCKRIAKGIQRYVIEAQEPFIVQYHSAKREGDDRTAPIDQPLPTQTTENRFALVVPTLIQTGYGERPGQAPRVPGLDKPIGTLVGGQKHALVSAFLAKHYTGAVGSPMVEPSGTVTSVDHHSLVTATMVAIDNQSSPSGQRPITSPLATTVTENRHALVMAHMTKFNTGSIGYAVTGPAHTITAGGEQARPGTAITQGIVTSHLLKMRGSNVGSSMGEPLHTISVQGTHHAEVRAFLIKYYGEGGQWQELSDPIHTQPTKDRFGLVTVHGENYIIVDIGLRMLTPRELARAQGFPDTYILDPLYTKERKMVRIKPQQGIKKHRYVTAPLSKSAQVRMIGNSVCPPVAKALIEANFTHEKRLAMAA